MFITAITTAELLHGVSRFPDGRRKTVLAQKIKMLLEDDFAGQVLAFDSAAALHYAPIVASRERHGRPVSMADAQIAAICHHHGSILATRNVKDFADTGVRVVDPWQGS